MNEEMSFPTVEDRLQAEAKRLLTERRPSASQLASVYRRRRRVRRAAQAAGGTAIALLAGLAVWFGGRRTEIARVPFAAQPEAVAQLDRGQQVTDASFPLQELTEVARPDDGVFAIPFVIGDPATGEEVITGIYVPEQVEPIDLQNLPPAERDAVRAVLGIEGEDTDVIQPI